MTEEMKQETSTPEATETPGTQEPSLDDLLNEYDMHASHEQPDAQPDAQPQTEQPAKETSLPPDYDSVRYFAEQYARDQHRREIDKTVQTIKEMGENLKEIDDEVIEGVLQARAAKDERVRLAWMTRHQKPSEWGKLTKALAKELDEKFRRPDKQVTEDREALRAAVRSGPVGDDKPSVTDLNKMSDAEFEAYKASL